ncbi:MAG: hypothetical protein U1E77_10060 [Inhella sp.]
MVRALKTQGLQMQKPALAFFLASLLLAGCAGTTVHKVKYDCAPSDGKPQSQLEVACSKPLSTASEGVDDTKVDGIRYYEASPYLLVYSDGKGGLVSKLIHLPDLTKKRVIQPFAYLAANNSTLTFANGMLTQNKVVADETAVPKAVIGALEQTAMAALGKSFNLVGAPSTPHHPPPYLFKVELSGGQAKLVGGPGIDATGKVRFIDVTVSKSDDDAASAQSPASGAK